MMKTLLACGVAGLAAPAAPAASESAAAHGFKVVQEESLPDISAKLVRMEHVKTGADLVWLDRDDDNKTFAIAFKTVPQDDTGVAHILEHAVLCGSGKYPVKDPFVHLLKSSFATFINAWTAPDHTAYPVCSRNSADFLNLIDIYLDAVFDPLCVKENNGFLQEGWHWEKDPESGAFLRNGVVYNEMKGVFADRYQLAAVESDRLLYPDNAYRFVSGGDPKAIPSLTFEAFRDFYRKHYHPSNAIVFLDGKVDLEAVMSRLDAAFAPYSKIEIDTAIPLQVPKAAGRTIPYEPPAGEDCRDKTVILDSSITGSGGDIERRIALKILASALAETNDEPLPRLLVGKGLCEDVQVSVSGCEQIEMQILVDNARDGKAAEIRSLIRGEIASLCDGGFDHEKLKAIMERKEFEVLERDFGTFPRGLAYFEALMGRWLYGRDLAGGFEFRSKFASLREKIDQGYFESLAREVFLENDAWARLEMVPDASLAKTRREEERLATEQDAKNMPPSALKDMESLAAYQTAAERAEDAARLPRLSLSDLDGAVSVPKYGCVDAGNGGGCVYPVKTQATGIAYVTLLFPLDGFSGDDLSDISFCAELYGELSTATRSAEELKKAIDMNLGRFATVTDVFAEKPRDGRPGPAHAYLAVKTAALDAKLDGIMELIPEILLSSDFNDPGSIAPRLTQSRRSMEFSAGGMSGRRFAKLLAFASLSSCGAVEERFSGFSALRRLQKLDDAMPSGAGAVCAGLGSLMQKVVAGGASHVFVSDNVPVEWARKLAARFPLANRPTGCVEQPFPAVRTGIVSQGDVANAAKAAFIQAEDGPALVAGRMLSLGHLWQEIRVKGGAYGGSFSRATSGEALFLSWNDPNPLRSLDVYDASAAELRKAAKEDVTDYIISALAKMEPYLTPSGEMDRALAIVASGKTPECREKLAKSVISTKREDILAFADRLEKAAASTSICIVGGEEQVKSCAAALDSIETVMSKEERQNPEKEEE